MRIILQERLKREYKNANKQREGYIDESDEDEEELIKLTQEGKTLQKTLKKLEKDGGYDESDEEENPYASEVSDISDTTFLSFVCLARLFIGIFIP